MLTTTYIINKIPATALKNQIPYEVLFKKPVDSDSLKVFGCQAFSSNVGSKQGKFKPRDIPCVFVGYMPRKKGYWLLNLIINVMFVSRDVLFKENIFSLNTDKSIPYMHLLG